MEEVEAFTIRNILSYSLSMGTWNCLLPVFLAATRHVVHTDANLTQSGSSCSLWRIRLRTSSGSNSQSLEVAIVDLWGQAPEAMSSKWKLQNLDKRKWICSVKALIIPKGPKQRNDLLSGNGRSGSSYYSE